MKNKHGKPTREKIPGTRDWNAEILSIPEEIILLIKKSAKDNKMWAGEFLREIITEHFKKGDDKIKNNI